MKPSSPLAMRLLLVAGKGGVGKTTVSVALALAAAKRGKRVLLVEVSPRETLSRLFDAPLGGHAEHSVAENIWTLNLDPHLALEEYLESQLHVRTLVRMVTGNPLFQRLVEVAPGWRDLLTLGKVWHLERQQDPKTGRPRYDLLIVDMPATGQGLAMLRTPRAFVKAFRFGPAKLHSQWVWDLIEDPKRTRLLLVTLPEELPVKETIEMARAAQEKLNVPFEDVVMNAVTPRLLTEREARAVAALRQSPEGFARVDQALEGEVSLADLLEAADAARDRRALHESHIRRLRSQVHKRMIELPFIYRAALSVEDLRALGEILVGREEVG
jgi:anion-transporting  ArsA/GET3 family ATPase